MSSLVSSLGSSLYGQTTAYWNAFYTFCRDVVGVTYDPQASSDLDLWADVAQSCDWWWPFQGLVIVSERPEVVRWEEARTPTRLHCATGPALKYRDGWAVYSLHGITVPRDVIENPESLSVGRIDAEKNAEVRRVLVDHYGRGRYIHDSGAKLLDEDVDSLGAPRRLWRRQWPDGRVVQFLEVYNSTPEGDMIDGVFVPEMCDGKPKRRAYFLGVHPECRPLLGDGRLGEPQKPTCHAAVAASFGRRGEAYSPSVES